MFDYHTFFYILFLIDQGLYRVSLQSLLPMNDRMGVGIYRGRRLGMNKAL
jgi:hypothetical protein